MKHLEAKGCEPIELDVTKAESIKAAVEAVSTATSGLLHVLINNAAISGEGPLLDTDIEVARSVLDANVLGPLAVTQAFSPLLVHAANSPSAAQDKRVVVLNASSISAAGLPWIGIYGASKAALQTLSDVMRMEMAGLNVHVTTLHLGGCKTPLAGGEKMIPISLASPSLFYHDTWPTINAKKSVHVHKTIASSPSPAEVAKTIFNQINKRNPPAFFWTGKMSSIMRWASWILPSSLFEMIMAKSNFTHLVGTGKAKTV